MSRVSLLLASAVLLAACGTTSSGDPVNGDNSSEYPNGITHIQGEMVTYSSVDSLAGDSKLVFVGTVIEVKDGFFEPAPETEDFKGTQYLAVVLRIDELFQGETDFKTVEMRWFGYDVQVNGDKGPQWIINGEFPPRVGEENVWFLTDIPGYTARTGAEGRVTIDADGGLKTTGAYSSGAAEEIEDMRVEDLRSRLTNSSG